MPNLDTPADLYRVEMRAPRRDGRPHPSPSPLRSAPLGECVRMVMADDDCYRAAYYIMVGNTKLMYREIEAIFQRADFPRGSRH